MTSRFPAAPCECAAEPVLLGAPSPGSLAPGAFCAAPSATSATRASRRMTSPVAPASTTPAWRRASSCDGVFASACCAAPVAAAATSLSVFAVVPAAASSAATAAARSTVITVPSTGSAIARSANRTAAASASATMAPPEVSSVMDCARPRMTWESTTPELPRAPRTAPWARASATSAAVASAPICSVASTAACMVCAMLEPVSASGTGNTLSSLISTLRRSSSLAARLAHERRRSPSKPRGVTMSGYLTGPSPPAARLGLEAPGWPG